jgi:hypothetical protein
MSVKEEESSFVHADCKDSFGYLNDQEPLEEQFIIFATQVTEKAQEVSQLIEQVVELSK